MFSLMMSLNLKKSKKSKGDRYGNSKENSNQTLHRLSGAASQEGTGTYCTQPGGGFFRGPYRKEGRPGSIYLQ